MSGVSRFAGPSQTSIRKDTVKQAFAAIGLGITLAVMNFAAYAQAVAPEQRQLARDKLKSMTPEERAQAREQAKARWDAMSPEEREAAKKRMADKRAQAKERSAERSATAASSPK